MAKKNAEIAGMLLSAWEDTRRCSRGVPTAGKTLGREDRAAKDVFGGPLRQLPDATRMLPKISLQWHKSSVSSHLRRTEDAGGPQINGKRSTFVKTMQTGDEILRDPIRRSDDFIHAEGSPLA